MFDHILDDVALPDRGGVISTSTAVSPDTKCLLKIPQEARSSCISPQAHARSEKQRTDPILGASVDTEEEARNKDKYVSMILTATVHDVVSF